MVPDLYDCDLEQLRQRLEQLDAYARAVQDRAEDLVVIEAETFILGGGPEHDWNDYHRVRNEYDRRAAEEFDLGQ